MNRDFNAEREKIMSDLFNDFGYDQDGNIQINKDIEKTFDESNENESGSGSEESGEEESNDIIEETVSDSEEKSNDIIEETVSDDSDDSDDSDNNDVFTKQKYNSIAKKKNKCTYK